MPAATWRRYRFVDWASQAFLAGVIVLLLVFHRTAPSGWLGDPWPSGGHGGIHALIHAEAADRESPIVVFLRAVYPSCFTRRSSETELINRAVGTSRLDPLFLEAEFRLFGTEPSVALMRKPLSFEPWVSELMYAAYFSYYVMIAGTGLWLWFRDRPVFRRYISVVSFVFTPAIASISGCRSGSTPSVPPDAGTGNGTWPGSRPARTRAFPAGIQKAPSTTWMAFIYRNFEALERGISQQPCGGRAYHPLVHLAVVPAAPLGASGGRLPAASPPCTAGIITRWTSRGNPGALVLIPIGNALVQRVDRDREDPPKGICALPDRG